MRIRLWTPEDLDATIATFRRAVHETATADYTPQQLHAWAPDVADAAAWGRRMAHAQAWVCDSNGALAGFISSDMPGHIDLLYVHPDYQRMGVATRLIQALLADAAKNGITRTHAEASRTARAFFEAQGYHVLRAQRVVRAGIEIENFVMERNA